MLQRTHPKEGAAERLGSAHIAYFCAEYGITDILPIYSGGLGVLAGDIVQESALLQLPFTAVGLLYKKGYFHQEITEDGQQETPQTINPADVPLTLMKDETGETILVEVPLEDRTVYAQIWEFKLGTVSLFLLDTDHWRNREDDRSITDQLYGGGQQKRIQQELILGVGGYRALKALGIRPDVYHMNEGHSAFLSLEVVSAYLHQPDPNMNLERAVELARRHLVFTNHTLVPAGNDAFPHDMVRQYVGKYAYESGIGIDAVLNLGHHPSHAGSFSMSTFALRMASLSNAVSQVHAEQARTIWPEFPLIPITNGVHMPAWVAAELQQLWDEYVPAWRYQTSDESIWRQVSRIPDRIIWQTHQELKEQLLDEVYAREGIRLDPNVLTVVWARRFATYKRPDLIFSDLERLKTLLLTAKHPVQILIAGKSHPADNQGKEIIEKIETLANYELKHRVVFVDNYSISLAKFLTAGADIWLNTPIFGKEASGTSGMKAAANGVVQVTVPDGWAYEVKWRGVGYSLPVDKTEQEIYPLLEKRIIPTFYRRGREDFSPEWVSMMKRTIATISPRFSSHRMVHDYITHLYKPLLEQ